MVRGTILRPGLQNKRDQSLRNDFDFAEILRNGGNHSTLTERRQIYAAIMTGITGNVRSHRYANELMVTKRVFRRCYSTSSPPREGRGVVRSECHAHVCSSIRRFCC